MSQVTISSYIKHLEDAFLVSESKRYDVKEKSYFDYPFKYYCEDIFPKIIVRRDIGKRWYDDNGILNIELIDFLLDETVV